MLRKKVLFGIAVLGCSLISFSVFANGASIYKHVPTCKSYGCESLAPNDGSGFYLGFQLGYANVDDGKGLNDYMNNVNDYYQAQNPGGSTVESHQENFGGRGFLGYSINKYLAAEVGAAVYPSNFYSVNDPDGLFNQDVNIKTLAFDANGKVSMPLGDSWNIYAKGGIAYVHAKVSDYVIDYINSSWRPTYGGGVSYFVNSNVVFNFDVTRIEGKDRVGFTSSSNPLSFGLTNIHSVIPSTTLVTLGIAYRFTCL